MLNYLKKLNIYQYASLITSFFLLVECFNTFADYRHYPSFILLIALKVLEICFCAVTFFKGFTTKYGVRILSVILILFSINCAYELIFTHANAFNMILLLVYYISSLLTLNKKMNYNFITFALGTVFFIISCIEMSHYQHGSFAALLFNFVILLIIYEIAEKDKSRLQKRIEDGTEKLKDLTQLLDENYITREDFDVMKSYIINTYKELKQ